MAMSHGLCVCILFSYVYLNGCISWPSMSAVAVAMLNGQLYLSWLCVAFL